MLTLSFSPLVPDYVLWALVGLVAVFALLALVSRGPVALVRADGTRSPVSGWTRTSGCTEAT